MSYSKEDEENFLKELEELGITLCEKEDFNKAIGVSVDIDTEIDYSHLVDKNLILSKKTKRNEIFYFKLKSYCTKNKRLEFEIKTPISDNVFNFYNKGDHPLFGTTFADLCWYYAEGTNNKTLEEVETKFREDSIMEDLSWYLPTRFIDSFIEVMHTINQSFLNGLMQESIIYGPILF